MSWSLEVFAPCDAQIQIEDVAAQLANCTPPLALQQAETPATPDGAPHDAAQGESATWEQLLLSEASGVPRVMGTVQSISFAAECEADPELLHLFESEIVASDAEDGSLDDEYTDRLRKLLENTRWHYILSVRQNNRPEQERAIVLAANVLAHACGGIVHDLQTGAWMDAELFDNLRDAYGAG